MTLEPTPTVRPARWSGRIAVFSASLLVVTLVLHRFAAMPTPLAINLFALGLAGAGLALLVGLAASARIWFTGEAGVGSAAVGLLLALAALSGPLIHLAVHFDRPWINDATTDWTNPPAFAALAQRPPGANPVAYPGQAFAELQAKAYPDLRTLVLERSVDEAFELAEEAVRHLGWQVIAEEPPMRQATGWPAEAGIIEATQQTLIVGFTDDIVVRIAGGETRARIDARSASRYGAADFGENAHRLRQLLAEIRARDEATPSAAAREPSPGTAPALVKRQKARDPQKAEGRNARDPAK